MSLAELVGDSQYEELMAVVPARELVRGALRVEELGAGWARPHRFGISQERALGSCLAWHPGLYRTMATCTSGVRLEFETDSTEVAIEVELDRMPEGTAAIIADVRRATPDAAELLDGVSADIDGRHVPVMLPDERNLIELSIEDGSSADTGAMRLPGMGVRHHVRVWLPCLSGGTVGRVLGDGTFIEPVPGTGELLVVGDSIAQGFCAGDPALTWPALLADRLGLGLVNQGVGGQVFQPGSLAGANGALEPTAIVVELGENYRYETCRAERVRADVRRFLSELAGMWPDTPTWVLTPMWHSERIYRTSPRSCFSDLPDIIAGEVAAYEQMTLVHGMRLLDADPTLMADGYEHPNQNGSSIIAERLALIMEATVEPESARRRRALDVLAGAPIAAHPLRECVRRGIGEVLYADEGCVFLRRGAYEQVIWSPSRKRGRMVLRTLAHGEFLTVLGSNIVRDAARVLGFRTAAPCHLAVYTSDALLPVGENLDIRPLDASYAELIYDTCSYPDYLGAREVEDMLEKGLVLGGFEDGELVGYIAERPMGSFGMLEVFPDHKDSDWAKALESAKINEQLARGFVPWCEIWPDNEELLKLQEELGLTVCPEKDMVFLESIVL